MCGACAGDVQADGRVIHTVSSLNATGAFLRKVVTTTSCVGQTGVEMEALCAASVALLTIYDMCKAVDRGMRIESIQLEEKRGGKSGVWQRAKGAL